MKALFVDTSAWVAVTNRRDQHHNAAAPFYRRAFAQYNQFLTTNLVAAETYILLRLDCGLEVALGWWERVNSSLKVKVVYADQETTWAAVELLRRFRDQAFSLTDAVSFTVMQRAGLQEAFAFDHHFATAGFLVLPGGG